MVAVARRREFIAIEAVFVHVLSAAMMDGMARLYFSLALVLHRSLSIRDKGIDRTGAKSDSDKDATTGLKRGVAWPGFGSCAAAPSCEVWFHAYCSHRPRHHASH